MTRIVLCGANGKMGKVIQSVVSGRDNCEIVAGVDLNTESSGFPVYSSFADIKETADVIIDFSNPALLESLLDYSVNNNIPVVIATTGYDDNQKKMIEAASEKAPVFFTYNMSMGINLLANLAKKAVSILGDDFDIEIVEKHHNRKLDAPSGTALALADAVNESLDNAYQYKFDRTSERRKRDRKEIGIQSLRGGNLVGEHEVMFAGQDEVVSFQHTAYSRAIFAKGAIQAAKFLAGKGPGKYDMSDVVA